MTNKKLVNELSAYALGTGGIGSWLIPEADPEIFDRLSEIGSNPIKRVQLNQLLVMGHEAPVSDGFFEYYWCSKPNTHIYNVNSVSDAPSELSNDLSIESLQQFKWGMNRLYIDSLLCWGSVRTGFRELRDLTLEKITEIFSKRCFKTELITKRGPFLPLENIAKDSRYLISEMACKSYEAKKGGEDGLRKLLLEAFREFRKSNPGSTTIKSLLNGEFIKAKHSQRQVELNFSADELLDAVVDSEDDLDNQFNTIYEKFSEARKSALINTKRYLSMVSDLDVYVATSMRTRQDFRDMVTKTEQIFNNVCLKDLELRFFDPTLSAADGHENKGLIECLMVKCAKILVYCAGEKESYGKDAEAAMALSLGKPVIFLTDHEQKTRFYKDVHPLSRLIRFETGVAVGAIVTDSIEHVPMLLSRIFHNEMEYDLKHDGNGYLRLRERLTGSIIRLQTNDRMLNETFWNHYHAG